MTQYIKWNEVSKRVDFPNGLVAALLDRLGMQHRYGQLECARNVFMVDAFGKTLWQVASDFDSDGGAFTNIFVEGGELRGYRWDGGIYRIDLSTGFAVPVSLVK